MTGGSSSPSEPSCLISSPRRNLKRIFDAILTAPNRLQKEEEEATQFLLNADAENKLDQRKLYLVLDLDETLAYTKRLPPGETPAGHKILVRGEPYDMVLRPGLQQFLRVAGQNFIVYLYTMVDDTVDVWEDDLPNLCLIRRFVGDPKDDGLMRLAWQIDLVHRSYYAELAQCEGDVGVRTRPDVRSVLKGIRGDLLAGCNIALTGVAQVDEETLDSHPLCSLVRLFGADLTLSVDTATHLVARKKDGWHNSGKIRRALQRRQVASRGCRL
ncbi:MAG: hypothetical protein SGPRY_002231 [Prymnesium sp.]